MTETDLILRRIDELREDMAAEREASRESRARTHQRIDELAERIAGLDKTVTLAGEDATQVRSALGAVETRINDGIQPVVDDWRDIMRAGRRVSWLLGVSGLVSGAALWASVQWAGDAVVNAIRHLLRIS